MEYSYQECKQQFECSFLKKMLAESSYGLFDWNLGCTVDQVFIRFKDWCIIGGPMKIGLVHCLTHKEYWDLAFETAFMMLPSDEQQKHNLRYYKEIYGPFLYK